MNGEVYKAARQNLIELRKQIGYVQLVSDCWGMLVEFEKEWHRRNGGRSQIENLFPSYESEKTMRQRMIDAGLDTEQMVHTLNWKHIHNEPTEFQTGDLAIILPQREGAVWYTCWFYNDDHWEISDDKDSIFTPITEFKTLVRVGQAKYTLRKKSWDEKEKILSDIDPNP